MDIWDLISGIYFMIVGLFFLVFNRLFMEKTSEYLNKKPLLKGMNAGNIRINRGLGIIAGCLFLVFGIMLIYKYLQP